MIGFLLMAARNESAVQLEQAENEINGGAAAEQGPDGERGGERQETKEPAAYAGDFPSYNSASVSCVLRSTMRMLRTSALTRHFRWLTSSGSSTVASLRR